MGTRLSCDGKGRWFVLSGALKGTLNREAEPTTVLSLRCDVGTACQFCRSSRARRLSHIRPVPIARAAHARAGSGRLCRRLQKASKNAASGADQLGDQESGQPFLLGLFAVGFVVLFGRRTQ